MKKNTLITFLILSGLTIFAQVKPEKIKIILFGTFHFRPTTDRNKTDFPDLLSEKRQAEIDSIANSLNNYGISKFFLEVPFTQQKRLDTWYSEYKNNLLKTKEQLSDEIVQIAFRAAVKNNTPLVAIDYKQELPYDKILKYENKHKNDSVNTYPFFDIPNPFNSKRKQLSKSTLSEYFIQLNDLYGRQKLMFDYIHYALGDGEDNNYVGEDFTSVWYDRNLKIFTNILRSIDPKKDKTIVILMGASHTTMFRQFFENHPMFEIVELDTIFK
jgi:hypothetical protein